MDIFSQNELMIIQHSLELLLSGSPETDDNGYSPVSIIDPVQWTSQKYRYILHQHRFIQTNTG